MVLFQLTDASTNKSLLFWLLEVIGAPQYCLLYDSFILGSFLIDKDAEESLQSDPKRIILHFIWRKEIEKVQKTEKKGRTVKDDCFSPIFGLI